MDNEDKMEDIKENIDEPEVWEEEDAQILCPDAVMTEVEPVYEPYDGFDK